MTNRRTLPLLLGIVLITGCANIGGKIRPVWSKGWSSYSCAHGTGLAVTVWSENRDRLEMVAVEVGSPSDPLVVQYTDGSGTALFRLTPGDYTVKASMTAFEPLSRQIKIGPDQKCGLEMVLAFENLVTIQ